MSSATPGCSRPTGPIRSDAAAAREIAARIENVSQGTEVMVSTSRQTNASAADLQQLAMGLAELSGKFRAA